MTETTALGSKVDLGGQWIGHDHHRVIALAAELGLTQYPMTTSKAPSIFQGSRRLRLASPAVAMAGIVLAGLELASRVGTTKRWNKVTARTALDRVPGSTARRLLEVAAMVSWTTDLDRLSVQGAARMIRNQHGLANMLATKGGAQDSLLVEGMGAITAGLASELGQRVVTGCRVSSIVRDDEGVTLHTSAGAVRAAKAIVAVPPPVAARISHQPPLPPERAAAEADMYMGTVYKALAVYDRPFWRDKGSAEFVFLDKPGRAIYDTTSPGGPGHLCVLVAGEDARGLDGLDAAQRRQVLLGPVADHFGPRILTPASWHEKSWHLDKFVEGGYVALPKPGTTGGYTPASCAPAGNLHWAGTETAVDHAGYFDGAIEAGARAAQEVLAALA